MPKALTQDQIAAATYMAVVEKKSAAQIANELGITSRGVRAWGARNGLKFSGETGRPCRWPWHEVAVGERFSFSVEDRVTIHTSAARMKREHGLVFRVCAKRGQPPFVERVA